MWSVVFGALAARRGQAGVVTLVALLACAAAAAAGWYAPAAARTVAVATVQAAPVEQRLVTATRPASSDSSSGSSSDAGGHLTQPFDPIGFRVISGGHLPGELQAAGDEGPARPVTLAHRDGVCTHLAVTGRCPAAPGEVLVPGALADTAGLATGQELRLATAAAAPDQLRVVGTYRVVDPFDPYWGDRQLAGAGAEQPAPEVLFTVAGAAGDGALRTAVSTHDLVVDPGVFATADHATLAAAAQAGVDGLTRQGYAVSTELPALVDRVAAEQRNVTTGVAVGVALLLLLTAFTLAVVFRAAADQTRADTAWWQLRGAPTGHGWLATLAPSVVPLLTGAALGTLVGVAVGHGLAGAGGGTAGTGWRLTAVLVGVTVAVALLAAVTTQLGTLRTPVRDLLRRVPVRRRWGRRLADTVVVLLVAAAALQAVLAGGGGTGIGLLAPGLAGLALALVAGWALVPLATRLARRALRTGRLGIALAALSMARRTAAHRLFALAAAAVALLTVVLVGADTTARSQSQRATVEAGAAQVVTVGSTDAGRLLAAVRAADPDGHEAMAVVRTPGQGSRPPVLAVDATRLPVVAGWRDSYGGAAAAVTAALRPPAPEPVAVTTSRLRVEAAGEDPDGRPLHLRVLLRVDGTGEPAETVLGPLTPERADHTGRVPACARGCRLVGFELLGIAHAGGHVAAAAGSRVDLYRLSGGAGTPAGPELVGPQVLGDASRWRPAVGEWERGPVIDARADRLRMTRAESTPPPPQEGPLLLRDDRAFLVDAPVPLPAVVAGWRPSPETAADPRLPVLGGSAVPVLPLRQAALLPALGEHGALVDLEYAHRADPTGGAESTAQVWLAPDAGAALMDRLRAAGLQPVRQESLTGHAARLAADGATAGARFQVAVALVVLLLAAAAMLARFTGQRADRAGETAALRIQGVGDRVVKAVNYGVPAGLAGAAVTVGVAAGLVGVALARVRRTGFVDGWALLPLPPPHPYPVVLAALLSTAVLVGAAVIAAAVAGRDRRKAERASGASGTGHPA